MHKRLLSKLETDICPGQNLQSRLRQTEIYSGQSLVAQGLISEQQLAECIASDLQIERWPDESSPVLDLVNGTSVLTLKKLGCMPVKKEAKALTVAFVDPYNLDALSFWEAKFSMPVKRVVVTWTGLNKALSKLENKKSGDLPVVNDGIEFLRLDGEVEDNSDVRKGSDGAEIVRLVNDTLTAAIRKRASDIHIEPGDASVHVRYRVDGTLREHVTYERSKHPSIVVRMKLLAELDISERRKPQDGRLALRFEERQVDMRVSTLPSANGEKIVLRILNDGSAPATLEMLGFRAETKAQLERMLHQPQGMLLVTGPTGSGKSSTLRAGLEKIVSPSLNIVTVENPVEYRIQGVNQVQVNERAGLSFSGALRSMLRQDPNVIMIGEIRDLETAEIAFKAATTGHLVLSTLHTNDAPSALTRLLGLEVPRDVLANALSGILAQRLLRKACPACMKTELAAADDPALERLNVSGGIEVVKINGCNECGQTGYRGRRAIEEFLIVSESVRDAISRGDSVQAIRNLARSEGMSTLVESGVRVIKDRQTSVEEVLRVVGDAPNYAPTGNTMRVSRTNLPVIADEPAPVEAPVQVAVPVAPPKPASAAQVFETRSAAPSKPDSISLLIQQTQTPTGPISVLVVEDDTICRKIIVKMLAKIPIQMDVREADSAESAQELLKEFKPELMFSDVCMPGSDGFEFLDWFREQAAYKLVPVILTTAIPESVGKQRSMMIGADGYIQKPYKQEVLEKIMMRMLKRVRPGM